MFELNLALRSVFAKEKEKEKEKNYSGFNNSSLAAINPSVAQLNFIAEQNKKHMDEKFN